MTDTDPTKRGSSRNKARKRALDILFEADLRELAINEVLAAHLAENTPPVRDFTVELVEGVAADLVTLDNLISDELPDGWSLGRMPRVDRNLARLATYELTRTATDAPVILAEAISLAAELSTDDSPAFLNGVLGAVSRRSAGAVG